MRWTEHPIHPSFHTHPFLLLFSTPWLAFHISQAPKYNAEAIYKASDSVRDISLWAFALSGQSDLMRNLYKFEWARVMWVNLIQFHRHYTDTNLAPTLLLTFVTFHMTWAVQIVQINLQYGLWVGLGQWEKPEQDCLKKLPKSNSF